MTIAVKSPLAQATQQRWQAVVEPAILVVNDRFDVDHERNAMREARATGRTLLSIRASRNVILIGPLWSPEVGGPCAGCVEAQAALRSTADDRMASRADRDRARRTAPPVQALFNHRTTKAITAVTAAIVDGVLKAGLADGELVTVSDFAVLRSKVARTFRCAVCANGGIIARGDADEPPPPLLFEPDVASPPRLTRSGDAAQLVARARGAVGGARFGHVTRTARLSRATFAVTQVETAAATPAGFGRGSTLGEADDVALLEAYERLAGFPHVASLVTTTTRAQLGPIALDVATMGRYSDEQLRSPLCRVGQCTDDTPIDWAWAHRIDPTAPQLLTRPSLVPAELAFPWYRNENGRRYYAESSSGTALGASATEALLNALLELIERDAFLRAWHGARPLPCIDPATIDDPASRLLRSVCEREGFDVHLLVASSDIAIPVVWALAINRERVAPASFSAAGADPDPVRAIRSAMWELAQQAGGGLRWNPRDDEQIADNPWAVDSVADHWRRYTVPRLLSRVEAALGGDCVGMHDAFAGWRERFIRESNGNLRDAVRFVVGLLAAAGCQQVYAVDQTTPDHASLGMSVIRAIVPGLIPLTFGQAHQRFVGLERLVTDMPVAQSPYDPHPFP
jgi:ribosomal protein S12 methylthiotransferase accessory factor